MDSLLKGLFGEQDDDDTQRNRAQDFISRYEQGAPYDGISDDEVMDNYQRVAGRLSSQQFEDSAAEAYARLSPQERQQFANYLQQQGGANASFNYDDPRQLAQYTSRVHQEQPDGLAGLLGGVGGGGLGGLLGGALGGGQGRGQSGNMLGNPIAKAVMGGIAAMAMKRMIGR
jgi:hypothetical protein